MSTGGRASCTHALYSTCENVQLIAGILLDVISHRVEQLCENTIEQSMVVAAHFSGTAAEGASIMLGGNQDFIVSIFRHDEAFKKGEIGHFRWKPSRLETLDPHA